jgi:hypothetical protein
MPISTAPARSAPHPQYPCGRCATCSSGIATQGSELPGAPCCLPRRRPDPFTGLGAGLVFPGRSSLDGGIDEFPLLRPTIRSSCATRSTSPVFAAVSSSIAAACAAITLSRDTHDPHSGTGNDETITRA